MPDYFAVYRANQDLKRENAELKKWQDVALSLENRVQRYQLLLNAAPDQDLAAVAARVIGEANRPFTKTMILNAGVAQGVKKGEAVANADGLIGRVYLAGERTSWVILLTDLNSRVPVVIEPSHRRAILTGDNTPSPRLELDVGDGPIKAGDRVISTGDGGLLPPDVPVGVVMKDGGRFARRCSPGRDERFRARARLSACRAAALRPIRMARRLQFARGRARRHAPGRRSGHRRGQTHDANQPRRCNHRKRRASVRRTE